MKSTLALVPLLVSIVACGGAAGPEPVTLAASSGAGAATGGRADVQVTVQARPSVDAVRLPGVPSRAAAGSDYTVWRTEAPGLPSDDATLPGRAAPGATLRLVVRYANLPAGPGGALRVWLEDDCGGAATPLDGAVDEAGEARFEWRAPAEPAVCLVSAGVSLDGLADRLPLALLVAE